MPPACHHIGSLGGRWYAWLEPFGWNIVWLYLGTETRNGAGGWVSNIRGGFGKMSVRNTSRRTHAGSNGVWHDPSDHGLRRLFCRFYGLEGSGGRGMPRLVKRDHNYPHRQYFATEFSRSGSALEPFLGTGS